MHFYGLCVFQNKLFEIKNIFSCVSTLTTTRLFRDPKSKSNKSLMLMALKYQCLPGPVSHTLVINRESSLGRRFDLILIQGQR